MKIHGLNIGNWLILERWIDHDLFEGIKGQGETSFMKGFGDKAAEKLKHHRDTWITKEDFEWIKNAGLNTVRIPIPHWIFGDYEPNIGCIEYLDNAIEWANELGLQVLIDMHGAAGSQNGEMHSGLEGIMEFDKPENVARTIDVMGKLANRYKDEKCLWGMQMLNEPSPKFPNDVLRDYYTRCYSEIRKYLDEDKEILFHDQFNLESWRNFMQSPEYKNVGIDTHIYHCFSCDGTETLQWHVDYQLKDWAFAINNMRKYFKLYIGEWSLGMHPKINENAFKDKNRVQKDAFYRLHAASQIINYESADGWFYWCYKVASPNFKNCWSYRDQVDTLGYFPKKLPQLK
jgi:glucan 1,3-beta-glucosidase